MRYYIGFSTTRFSLVSTAIRLATRSRATHVFLLAVNKGQWARVYHLDQGVLESVKADEFFSRSRVRVTHLFLVPAVNKIKAFRALMWFADLRTAPSVIHVFRMAYEWLFNKDISSHRVRYCTEAVAMFLLKAQMSTMTEAAQRVVSPGEMLEWIINKGWTKVYDEECTITDLRAVATG